MVYFSETSKVDYVLFEASGLIKDGLIREWDRLSGDDIKGLRAYLLAYVTAAPSMSNYVRERIVQVIAIIVKRQSIDDMGADRRQVLDEVKQLIVGGNMQVHPSFVFLAKNALFGQHSFDNRCR